MLRADVPRTAREIINRIDGISFNSAFITELAAIAFIEEIAKDRVRRMSMHIINDKALDTLGGSSKVNNKRTFLEHLRKIGWSAAEHWLDANLRFVGERSTVDLSGRANAWRRRWLNLAGGLLVLLGVVLALIELAQILLLVQ